MAIFDYSASIEEHFHSSSHREARCPGSSIVLIGMPGSGKTTIGMLIAQALDLDFIDVDAGIEASTGESIFQTFSSKGEQAFRDIEAEYVKKAALKNNVVISTGGGVVLRPDNMETIRDCGIVLFVDRDIRDIANVDLSDRPLISGDATRLHKLHDERIGLYKKHCDLRVENRLSADHACAAAVSGITALRRRGRSIRILVVNGPNINMFGVRDSSVYGDVKYSSLCREISAFALDCGIYTEILQSNYEGDIVTILQKAYGEYDGIVINPGALAHYSHSVADAIECCRLPVVEAHISNIHSREDFRHASVTALRCKGMICGLGTDSYTAALRYLSDNCCKN